MASRQAFELAFLLLVLALALAGFSSIYVGGHARPDRFQHLHVATSIAWLGLLSVQWRVVRQRRFHLQRTIGVASYEVDRAPGFVLATLGFAIALDVARRRTTTRRASTPAGSAMT